MSIFLVFRQTSITTSYGLLSFVKKFFLWSAFYDLLWFNQCHFLSAKEIEYIWTCYETIKSNDFMTLICMNILCLRSFSRIITITAPSKLQLLFTQLLVSMWFIFRLLLSVVIWEMYTAANSCMLQLTTTAKF